MIRVVAFAIVAAVATTGVVSSVSAQSSGVSTIVAAMTKDAAKMKAACQKGGPGVTAYTTETVTALVKSGAQVNPADGQAAGAEAGKRCPEFLK